MNHRTCSAIAGILGTQSSTRIEDGLELMYQIFPSIGLKCASNLARKMSKNALAQRWEHYAANLREAVLHELKYSWLTKTAL